ncbi:hypothetical protein AAW52_04425 [Vibrio diabolicus]|nr:hypothetical protein AAW52_04425 [Vibrio diabolicus]
MIENDIKPLIADLLAEREFALCEEKMHITHINDGSDFLGFNHRIYLMGISFYFMIAFRCAVHCVGLIVSQIWIM